MEDLLVFGVLFGVIQLTFINLNLLSIRKNHERIADLLESLNDKAEHTMHVKVYNRG